MAAPSPWEPGIFLFFLLENPPAIKFLVLGGGRGFFRKGGGVEVPSFIFMGVGIFPINSLESLENEHL